MVHKLELLYIHLGEPFRSGFVPVHRPEREIDKIMKLTF